MAQNLVPSGGGGGTLVITVNATSAIATLNVLQLRIINMVNATNQNMARMSQSFATFGGWIGKAVAALGGFFVLRQITALVEGFLSRMIEVNRTFTGFMASMGVIKGSAAAAAQEYQFLLSISNKIGVPLEQSITQYHRLAAAMKNVDTTGEVTRHIFAGVSEAAVVLQARGHDTTLIFEAIQQMASKGKLSLEELQRQLGNTLPGAISIAARSMMQSSSFMEKGIKTVSGAERELRKQIKDGTINVYEFLARFSNQLKLEYGAGVKTVSDSFAANFARMKNAVFEFYRSVGSSSAMSGLTSIVKELAGLFNDATANSAAGLGQALGQQFQAIAEWIGKLDSSDVIGFFSAISGAIEATGVVVSTFLESFSFMGSSEMKTPVLDFTEFMLKTMALLADSIKGAIAAIEVVLRGFVSFFSTIGNTIMKGVDGIMYVAEGAQRVTGGDTKKYDDYRKMRAEQQKSMAANSARLAEQAQVVKDTYGLDMSPGYKKVDDIFTQLRKQMASAPKGVKAGSTAIDTAKYFNPLDNSEMQALIDQITANSGAPNGPKTGKPKNDPVQTAYMRETTRLVKDLAVAQNELDNVLANKNLTEGKAEAQMRALITTDERYLAMSDSQKSALMATAKALDEVNRKLENAIKLQKSNNDTLEAEFDVRTRLAEIGSSGYESKYRQASTMRGSFLEGGDNQNVDPLTQQKMLANAVRQDNAARSLDMARMQAQMKQQNDELLFQSDLYGKTALEVQKQTEYHRIDLQISQLMVGATQEMQAEYLKLGQIMKDEVSATLDQIKAKQQDLIGGVNAGLVDYMDSISDTAGQMHDFTVNSLKGMEDAFVNFALTGKSSFKELANSMIADLIRIMVRYNMMIMMKQVGIGVPGDSGGGGLLGGLLSMLGLGGGAPASGATNFGIPLPGSGGSNFFLPSAKGNAFSNGHLEAFGNGGIMNGPTFFNMRYGRKGVGGEAGTEGILPLKRGPGGKLGVTMYGGSSGEVHHHYNVSISVEEGTPKQTADHIARKTVKAIRHMERSAR